MSSQPSCLQPNTATKLDLTSVAGESSTVMSVVATRNSLES